MCEKRVYLALPQRAPQVSCSSARVAQMIVHALRYWCHPPSFISRFQINHNVSIK